MAGSDSYVREPGSFRPAGEVAWQPSEEYIARSRLKRFMDRFGISSFAELHARSIEDSEWFWKAVLDEIGIEFYEPYRQILDLSRGLPWARWCVGGKMNIVHNCVDKWIGTPVEHHTAIIWEGEEGIRRSLTYGD